MIHCVGISVTISKELRNEESRDGKGSRGAKSTINTTKRR
jgi:hypothetical protein